jgi:hypothetical protein
MGQIRPVSGNPFIPRPTNLGPIPMATSSFLENLVRSLAQEIVDHAFAINRLVIGPLPIEEYTVANLPAAADHRSSLVTVSNETGGYTVAFSDGTNWRRVQDRVIVS